MPNTTSNNVKFTIQTTGENANTWGQITNTNLQILEQAISGYDSYNITTTSAALAVTNGALSNGKNMVLKFTGTLTANTTVTIPDSIEKVYILQDTTTRGGFSLTFKTVSGTGVTLINNKIHIVYSDGTNVTDISGSSLANTTLQQVVSNGGTSDGTINVSNLTVTAATNVSGITISDNVTAANNITTTAGNMVIRFSSTGSGLSAARTVTVPNSIEKFYLFIDDTTHDGNTLTVKMDNGTSSGFTCVEGKSHFAYADGSEIRLVSGSQLANLTLNDILTNGNSSSGTINVSNITVTAATTCNTIVASSNISSSGGDLNDQKGEIRLVPLITKSSNYTLQATDHGKIISISAGDITVPSGVFSAGQTVTIYADGAKIDINRSGVTMYWAQTGADANRDLQSRGVATIICVASNTFVITGGLLS